MATSAERPRRSGSVDQPRGSLSHIWRLCRKPLVLGGGHRRFGRGNPSAIEQRSEARGCIGSHLWRYVAVEFERGLHAIVPQSLAHSFYVDSFLEQ